MAIKGLVRHVVESAAKENFSYPKIELIVGENITTDQKKALDIIFSDDSEFFYALDGARRSGKTELLLWIVIFAELLRDKGDIFLGSIDARKIKSLLWNKILDTSAKYCLGFKKDVGKEVIITPMGTVIFFKSLKDKAVIEWARGEKFKLAIVDESQSVINKNLKTFVFDAVGPAMQDFGGKIVLSGTPSILHRGVWYDWVNKAPDNGVVRIHLTPERNEFLSQKMRTAYLDKVRKSKGLKKGEEDASFLREYMGLWVVDDVSLVFRYNEAINDFQTCPYKYGEASYVIGVDLGHDDADAFCVMAYSLYDLNVYMVEELVRKKQGATETVKALEPLWQRYGCPPIVVDTGGLGKKVGKDFMNAFKVPIYPAEKTNKGGYLHIMRNAPAQGRAKG